MKLKFLFAVALFCAYLAGCSSSDSSSNSTSDSDLARYTVVIYGSAGGEMDELIENVYEQAQPLLKNNDVRVVFCYKYGKDTITEADSETGKLVTKTDIFSGKYAKPGQLVVFELTKDLDLNTISEDDLIVKDSLQLFEPGLLSILLEVVADSVPAKDYILVMWGHGGGFDFDNDYPKDMRKKGALAKTSSNAMDLFEPKDVLKAILYDEWLENGDAMDMYEFKQELETSPIKHFKSIFFHNCLLSNLESLSEIYAYTDYIISSEHVLATDGDLLVNFIGELYDDSDFESIVQSVFDKSEKYWAKEYKEEAMNGDLNLLKASEIESLFPIFKKIAKRLKTLYKDHDQKLNIEQAYLNTYNVDNNEEPLYDALDYAYQLAKATKDSALTDYAKELGKAFNKLIISQISTHYNTTADLDSFTLSLVLINHNTYNSLSDWDYTNKEAYEFTTFHKKTGWGNWLDTFTFFESNDDDDDFDENLDLLEDEYGFESDSDLDESDFDD